MQNIPDFKIDKWIRENESNARASLHGSYVSALSLNDLRRLAQGGNQSLIDFDIELTYGQSKGSKALRERLAELHSSPPTKLTADNVVITPGSIMANYLVLTTLCGPGDHVICQYPTFGQLYMIPRFHGAEVELWNMRSEDKWQPNVEELASMIKPSTKLIIINNPNNPTGAVLSEDTLVKILDLAKTHGLTVFSDEVFSPLFHTENPRPPPLASLGYHNSLSTGSLSKAHGLPGIRVGWVVSPNPEILRRITVARDYTTISVSQLDDSVASFALRENVLPHLLARNLAICRSSIALLEGFVERNAKRCRWVAPEGSGTAFIQLLDEEGKPVNDTEFCTKLAAEVGVSVIPGRQCFSDDGLDDFPGYVRITLGEDQPLREGLPLLESFLKGTTKGHEQVLESFGHFNIAK